MVPRKTSRQKLCSLPGLVMEVGIPCVASDEVMVYLFLKLGNDHNKATLLKKVALVK